MLGLEEGNTNDKYLGGSFSGFKQAKGNIFIRLSTLGEKTDSEVLKVLAIYRNFLCIQIYTIRVTFCKISTDGCFLTETE